MLIGQKVDVYWNLHRNVWSIRDRRTRRVIAHLDSVVLADVTFVVSAAGNAKVRAQGRKNVHAFARGTIAATIDCIPPTGIDVTYNPYRYTTFVNKATEAPVRTASVAWLAGRSVRALDTTANMP